MTKEDLKIIDHPVPNYTKGRTQKVRFGVIHFTSAVNVSGYEKDPYNVEANLILFDSLGTTAKFSAHYLITREGQIYQWVQIQDTAWHAGKSCIAIPEYLDNLNSYSVGIEILCKEGDKYTTAEYQAAAHLAVFIEDQVAKNNLGYLEHWVGHDWIAGEIAVRLGIRERSQIKVDPGPCFDWDIFNRERYRTRLEPELMVTVKAGLKDQILDELSVGECLSLFIGKLFKGKKQA